MSDPRANVVRYATERRVARVVSLDAGTLEPGFRARADQVGLKFSEPCEDVGEQFSFGCSKIEALSAQIKLKPRFCACSINRANSSELLARRAGEGGGSISSWAPRCGQVPAGASRRPGLVVLVRGLAPRPGEPEEDCGKDQEDHADTRRIAGEIEIATIRNATAASVFALLARLRRDPFITRPLARGLASARGRLCGARRPPIPAATSSPRRAVA